MFMLWAENMYSFPYLLLESIHNPRREGGLSMYWLCRKDDLASEDTLVWVAFLTLQQFATGSPLCALLPYCYKKSTTPAMIKYGFGRQRQAIEWLN